LGSVGFCWIPAGKVTGKVNEDEILPQHIEFAALQPFGDIQQFEPMICRPGTGIQDIGEKPFDKYEQLFQTYLPNERSILDQGCLNE
jgi:hypothetical protein